jgi:hypothetical protein
MTFDERVQAVLSVSGNRLTDRQARFLVMVMLHSGVCLRRHYSTFASLTPGRKVHDFFDLLVQRRYVTARRCGASPAWLYHVRFKPLYAAIGEPDNRHRKQPALPRAVERLMLLDAVMEQPASTVWLTTESEKVAHFTLDWRVPVEDLPALTFRGMDSETVRRFPDKLPIAIDADRQAPVFLYLVTRSVPFDFRAFLERHADLLRALPRWILRVVFPQHLTTAVSAYHAAFREQLAVPLRLSVMEELRWYFEARARGVREAHERFDYAESTFATPRFRVLYRCWRERGNRVLDATISPVLAEAIERGAGRFEGHTLRQPYRHLYPLVGTA